MRYVDYGLGVFARETLLAFSAGISFDLAQVYSSLTQRGLLGGYEVHQRFYEIGSVVGLAETDKYLSAAPHYR
jgi:hypothetical protein